MNAPNWLDDHLGLSGEAKRFLADVNEWVYGHRGDMPVPAGNDYVQQIVRGLCFRLVNEKGQRLGEKFAAKWNAGQRLHRGAQEEGTEHSFQKRADAVALFEKLDAEGKLKKNAEAEVCKRFGVKPRTLRYWRKKSQQSPASF